MEIFHLIIRWWFAELTIQMVNDPSDQTEAEWTEKPIQSVILPIKMTSIVKYWVVMMSNVGIKFKAISMW